MPWLRSITSSTAPTGCRHPNSAPLNAALILRACTVTLNRAPYAAGLDNLRNGARVVLNVRSSIVAGNMAGATSSDLANNDLLQNAGFNLIGGTPGLAPLANNGGPTLTHALGRAPG